jgi:hypothetical protein
MNLGFGNRGRFLSQSPLAKLATTIEMCARTPKSGRAMKHRDKSSKLKYEHALIEGLRPLLESIAPWEDIHSIIPGRIRRAKGSKRRIRLEIKYFTGTGLKALAKTGTAVQEVFFVTSNPQAVRERLQATATRSGVDSTKESR